MMANRGLTYTELEEQKGWTNFLTVSESEIDDLVADIQGLKGKTARIIRGQRCLTKDRLLQEIAAALQFPHYFGENWDALEECLGDLGWIDAEELVLVITNTDRLLAHHEADLETFLKILSSAHDLEDAPLERVVFHCEESEAEATKKRLKANGLKAG